jgi:hypothetical protein
MSKKTLTIIIVISIIVIFMYGALKLFMEYIIPIINQYSRS